MTIELIESKIKIMNGDTFHRFGDHFLYYDQGEEYNAINPIGQAEGKQKSRGGMPDTVITLEDGKYILIQYTTQDDTTKSVFNAKLLKDLQDCFDTHKTQIKIDEIKEVVLCFNGNVSISNEKLLKGEAAKYGTSIKIFNLSTIAHKIYRSYQYLAKDYLGIEIDSYQLMPLAKFVEEYDRGGMATPLSNPLLARKQELVEIAASIQNNLITTVTGKPGVGKSRLVVESVKNFIKSNKDYQAICIKNKDQIVIHDLRKSLIPGKKYLIYIDDANKSIDHLRSVFTFYEEGHIELKIILTIRDYLIREIISFIEAYSNKIIRIAQPDDQVLREIIAGKPFNIKNPLYQDRILSIAKGNPRLSIMTAIAAKNKSLADLSSVTEIYTHYFEKVTADRNLIFKSSNLKVLGILSFFRGLDKDHPNTKKILKVFKIKSNTFWKKIYDLEKLEIVDVYGDQSLVRFSDQILESYIFFRAFFIDKVLDYKLILFQFFNHYKYRILNTTIEANNTFGFNDFGLKMLPFVKEKYTSLTQTDDELLEFFEIFWFYLQDEALLFAKKQIKLKASTADIAVTGKIIGGPYNTKIIELTGLSKPHQKDKLFDLLKEFLRHDISNFITGVELIFNYVEKQQHLAEPLAKFCTEQFHFSPNDEMYAYYRQVNFSKLLIEKVDKGSPIFLYIFFRVLPHFLQTSFNSTILRGNKFAITKNLPNAGPEILAMRGLYWDCFSRHFTKFPEISLFVLKSISQDLLSEFDYETRIADWPYLLQIFTVFFDYDNLEHVYIVNHMLDRMVLGGINENEFKEIRTRANTEKYKQFLALDWSISRRKERKLEKILDYQVFDEKFRSIKQKDILATFSLISIEDYEYVFDFIIDAHSIDFWEHTSFANSAQIILRKALETPELFISLLEKYFRKSVFFKIVNPQWLFNSIQNNCPEIINKIEKLVLKGDYPENTKTQIIFYDTLYPENITEATVKHFLEIIQSASGPMEIYFYHIKAYVSLDNLFLCKALKSLLNLVRLGSINFTTQHHFIEKHFSMMESDTELAEELYLHLVSNGYSSYDYQGSELLFLVNNNPKFFLKYLDLLFQIKKASEVEDHQISIVWNSRSYIEILTGATDKLIDSGRTNYLFDEIINHLFISQVGIDEFDNKKATFFKAYISTNVDSAHRIEGIFKIIIGRAGIYYNEIIKHYLTLLPDFDLFKKIDWLHRTTVLMNGNTITGELDESKWMALKNLIDELNPKSQYLEHKEFINERIDRSRKSAVAERRRNFLRELD